MSDLNNHLFAQIERLSDENLSDEKIEQELKRTDGVVKIAEQIISNAELCLRASKLLVDNGYKIKDDFLMIDAEKTEADYRGK